MKYNNLFLIICVSLYGGMTLQGADFIKFLQQKADEGAKAVQQAGDAITKGVEDAKKEAGKIAEKVGKAGEDAARDVLHKVVIPTAEKVDQAEADAKKFFTPKEVPHQEWLKAKQQGGARF